MLFISGTDDAGNTVGPGDIVAQTRAGRSPYMPPFRDVVVSIGQARAPCQDAFPSPLTYPLLVAVAGSPSGGP
mgnify:CR=1 FL=1